MLKDGMPDDFGRLVLWNRRRQDRRSLFKFADECGKFGMSRQLAFERGELLSLERAQHVKRGQFFSFLRAHA